MDIRHARKLVPSDATGQAVGVLLGRSFVENGHTWNGERIAVQSRESSSDRDFFFLMSKIMDVAPHIKRIVVSYGASTTKKRSMCLSVTGGIRKEAALPTFFIVDVTAQERGASVPTTISAYQGIVPETIEEQGAKLTPIEEVLNKLLGKDCDIPKILQPRRIVSGMYVNGEKVCDGLSGFVGISKKLGMGEFWERMTGIVKPSYGSYTTGEGIYFPDSSIQTGLIKNEYVFPRNFDRFDFGRFETMLVREGVFPSHPLDSIDEKDVKKIVREFRGEPPLPDIETPEPGMTQDIPADNTESNDSVSDASNTEVREPTPEDILFGPLPIAER